jgi:hypothetical protein
MALGNRPKDQATDIASTPVAAPAPASTPAQTSGPSFEDEADTGTVNAGNAATDAPKGVEYNPVVATEPGASSSSVSMAEVIDKEYQVLANEAAPGAVAVVDSNEVIAAAAAQFAKTRELVLSKMGVKRDVAIRVIQNAIPTAELENMGAGVFPRVTVGLDGFSKDADDLGKVIGVKLYSWSYLTLVTTGEQDDETANKLVRGSYDGINLKGNEGTVKDYIEKLRAEYEKAGSKQYIEAYGMLVYSSADGDIDPDNYEMVQVSLPPTSVGQWSRFMIEQGIAASEEEVKAKAEGREPVGALDTTIYARQAKRVKGNKKWGVMLFSRKKPQEV